MFAIFNDTAMHIPLHKSLTLFFFLRAGYYNLDYWSVAPCGTKPGNTVKTTARLPLGHSTEKEFADAASLCKALWRGSLEHPFPV